MYTYDNSELQKRLLFHATQKDKSFAKKVKLHAATVDQRFALRAKATFLQLLGLDKLQACVVM